MTCDRRFALAMLGGAAATPFLPATALAAESFVMWRDPGCGCCLAWAKRMEAAFGRRLPVVDAADMAAIKRARGVPVPLRSCHTALIQGYAVEGHVPPVDVRRLIATRPAGVTGLAVPGMPLGAPGMEHGAHRDAFKVMAFGPGRRPTVFASHAGSR